jgi:hypothetical protein
MFGTGEDGVKEEWLKTSKVLLGRNQPATP